MVGIFFVGPTRVESMVFFLLLLLAGYLFFADGFIPSFWAARSFRCASSTDAIKAEDTPLQVKAADLLISAMFKIKPLKKYVTEKARSDMVERGLGIDVDWVKDIEYFDENIDILYKNYDEIVRPQVMYPDYYQRPFHAYEDGNLSWKAAKEVECAALTVHAPIFTPSRDILERNGDSTLRDNFHKNMLEMLNLKSNGYASSIKRVVDLGCSTGLSTIKCFESFPQAEIIGIDLSPYMLSVAKFQLDTKKSLQTARRSITYRQAAAEEADIGEKDVDLVTMCLVSHELPTQAAKAIFVEAYRMLKPGGAFSLMDMDPNSLFFQKFAGNPMAFAAFKSTEPWIQEYVSMDLEKTLASVGFVEIQVKSNSPRHRTVVAYKH